ncbi:hypothetical protein ASPNIDRAFT_43792 [Aspergillus niger]|uniref:Uncharacterized protein n=1 Tax=Aspergillus niger TaxID=5061 RepID=A0A100IUF8_ASPNG|nr:hypothetical protein ASPNIDRAFT_43792 [Aspergillus niger]
MFVTYTVETLVYTSSAGCKLVGEAISGQIVVPTAMVSVEVTVRTWVVRIVEVVESLPGEEADSERLLLWVWIAGCGEVEWLGRTVLSFANEGINDAEDAVYWLDDCIGTEELGCRDEAELDVIAGREAVDFANLELGVNVRASLYEGECELLSCIAMEELAAADGWFGMDDFSEVVNDEVSTIDAGTEADENCITGVDVDVDEGVVVPKVTRVLEIAGIELDTATEDVEDGTTGTELV